jgi:lipoprotein signal peptidase
LGGAVSNLFDRLLDGTVTDFINIGISTLNLADVAIIAGIVLLAISNVKVQISNQAQNSK